MVCCNDNMSWELRGALTSSKMTMGQGRSAPEEGGMSRPQLTEEMCIFTCTPAHPDHEAGALSAVLRLTLALVYV